MATPSVKTPAAPSGSGSTSVDPSSSNQTGAAGKGKATMTAQSISSEGDIVAVQFRLVDFIMVASHTRDSNWALQNVNRYLHKVVRKGIEVRPETCKLLKGNFDPRGILPRPRDSGLKKMIKYLILSRRSTKVKELKEKPPKFTLSTYILCRGYADANLDSTDTQCGLYSPMLANLRHALVLANPPEVPRGIFTYATDGIVHDLDIDSMNSMSITNAALRWYRLEFKEAVNVTIVFPRFVAKDAPFSEEAYVVNLVTEIGQLFNCYRSMLLNHADARLTIIGGDESSSLAQCIGKVMPSHKKLPPSILEKGDILQEWFFQAMIRWMEPVREDASVPLTYDEFLRKVRFFGLDKYQP